MTLSSEPIATSKLGAIVDQFSTSLESPLGGRFVRELFAEVDTAEFDSYKTETLVSFASEAFKTFYTRRTSEPAIVWPPAVTSNCDRRPVLLSYVYWRPI